MSKLQRILFLIFFAVFVFSAAVIARYAANSYAQKRSYRHLVELAEQSAENEAAQPVQPSAENAPTQEPTMLARYEALYRENDDLVGWIKIDGTNINYPVVQSKDAPNFYLKHDFEKNIRSQSSSSRSAVQQEVICCSNRIKMVQKPRKIKVFRGFTVSKRADMI